jgi:hypothetical protein
MIAWMAEMEGGSKWRREKSQRLEDKPKIRLSYVLRHNIGIYINGKSA